MSSGFHCLVACMVEVQTVQLLNPISGLRLFVKPVVKLVREKILFTGKLTSEHYTSI